MRKTVPKTHRYCDLTPLCCIHAVNTCIGRLNLDEPDDEEALHD